MFPIKALINKRYRTQSRTDNLETQAILGSSVIERKQNKTKQKQIKTKTKQNENKVKHNRFKKKKLATSHR